MKTSYEKVIKTFTALSYDAYEILTVYSTSRLIAFRPEDARFVPVTRSNFFSENKWVYFVEELASLSFLIAKYRAG